MARGGLPGRCRPGLSVVIPTLNESGIVVERLQALQELRHAGHELVLVDGGSDDGTRRLAAPFVDRLDVTVPGRARQLNRGAALARGEVLWFLHLDTRPHAGAAERVLGRCTPEAPGWGRFDVRLSGQRSLFRAIGTLINLRSRMTGIATGDQGIFVRHDLFLAVGGFPDIPLMEDVALSRRLKRHGRPVCLRPPLVTSSRRWERDGAWRVIRLMWFLRLAYALGADPEDLARRYPVCGCRTPDS